MTACLLRYLLDQTQDAGSSGANVGSNVDQRLGRQIVWIGSKVRSR
jgi:hypothetical protein